MRTQTFAVAVALGTLLATPTWAQQEKPEPMPQIEAPRKPAPEEQTGVLRGNKPFSLTTDPDGEFVYKFNENNELDSLEAKKGVVFTSEDMTLNADRLDYKAIKGELTATGKRVVVRQGDLIITCKLFKYYPDKQHSEFIGNAVVYNKTKDGKVQTTAADKIIVDIVDGKAQMKVQGAGRVRPKMSQVATAPNVVATPGSGGARAMILEPKQGALPASGGEETGASTPIAAESKTTSSVKLVPVLGMEGGSASSPAQTGTNEPKKIDPTDRRQMEELSQPEKKKSPTAASPLSPRKN
ncbi:MAG: hypothetical protein ACPL7D_01345 [Candidatus Sumerlaeaceae bacterium]